MRIALALVLLSVLLSLACANVIARKYEYEEEVFLDLDGSATVYVNASVPALVALRGFKLPLDPNARLDRMLVRDLYTTPATTVALLPMAAPRLTRVGITSQSLSVCSSPASVTARG